MSSDVPPPVMRLYHHPSGRWGWALAYGPADGDARGMISSTLLFETPELAERDACSAADAFHYWAATTSSMTAQVYAGLAGGPLFPETRA